MKHKLKIGLWIPPRTNLNSARDPKTPETIDATICSLIHTYLEDVEVEYFDDLDFRKAVIQNDQVYIGDFCLNDLDHFIWEGMIDRHIDSYHLEVLRVLEMSIKVHNSYSFYNVATDKFLSMNTLHNHGIPVANHFLINQENVETVEPLFEKHSFLLKPRRSSFGLGIIKVDRFSQLRDILEYQNQKNYYIEKFYPNDMCDWIGVTVINGTALYGFRKKTEKISGWKVYDRKKSGGKVDYVRLSPELEEISIKVGEVLGGNFYGLDFIKTAEGYKLVDLNCHPGIYYDLIKELDLPIAEIFLDMLEVPSPVCV